jgi:N-acetylglutamate synthase-like GNAT family acetyltransferase
MADDMIDTQLRDMAQHRGLKLVKSRRRQPGVGDFGKYGLTDADGKALLGIGQEGLTASAKDIQAFLRANAMGSWKKSAETTPERRTPKAAPQARVQSDENPPVRRRSKRASPSDAPQSRAVTLNRPDQIEVKEASAPAKPEPAVRKGRRTAAAPDPEPVTAREQRHGAKTEPELVIRPAKPADAGEVAALIRQLAGVSISSAEVTDNLAAARKAKSGIFVAELGEVVGCCGWAVVPTIHRGPIGRLTVLIVDTGHRRKRVATKLLAAADHALANAGCRKIEAVSDIAISNAHNFFRSLGFEQASYRFVRAVAD